jgi:hypothetical protein
MDATYQILCKNKHYFVTDRRYDIRCSCGADPEFINIIDDLCYCVEGSFPHKKFVKIGVDKDGRDICKVDT